MVELDSGNGNITLLKGIAARSDIGFLSLFEHYDVCQVPAAPQSLETEGPWEKESGGREVQLQVPELVRIWSSLSPGGFGKQYSFTAVEDRHVIHPQSQPMPSSGKGCFRGTPRGL